MDADGAHGMAGQSDGLCPADAAVYKVAHSLPREKGIDHDIAAILAVSDTFNVSNEAAQYRLLDFGLINSTAPVQTLIDFADAI